MLHYVQEKGVNLLGIRASSADKYALALMDALFTDEEMAKSCYMLTKRSKKPPLPTEKITLGRYVTTPLFWYKYYDATYNMMV